MHGILERRAEAATGALNGQDPSQGLGRVLAFVRVADVQMTMRNLLTPPNAPVTIAMKGVDNLTNRHRPAPPEHRIRGQDARPEGRWSMILGQEPITLSRYNAALTTWGCVDGRVTHRRPQTPPSRRPFSPPPVGTWRPLKRGSGPYTASGYTPPRPFVWRRQGPNPCDRLVIDGEVFEVAVVMRQRSVIPHFKAIAVEVRE